MRETTKWSAHGKLLITGEYLILKGATGLALPLRFGQDIEVHSIQNDAILWKSYMLGEEWFSASFHRDSLEVNTCSDPEKASFLASLLSRARFLNPEFLSAGNGASVVMYADYPLEYGWGSSATLIALVAQWAEVDAFTLFRKVSRGSGYDIACADRNTMILYTLAEGDHPVVQEVQAGSVLTSHTVFAYLEKSQSSDTEVAAFLSSPHYTSEQIRRISEISVLIAGSNDIEKCMKLLREHEEIMSGILQKKPLSASFPDFPGIVKSLGAWGGDFALFLSTESTDETRNRLTDYGLRNAFTYADLV